MKAEKPFPVEAYSTSDSSDAGGDNAADAALVELGLRLKSLDYRFTTVTPLTHSRVNARPANQWAQGLEGVFGWSRPFEPMAVPDDIFSLMQQARILIPHDRGWRSSVRASTLGEVLFFHSAYPTSDANAVFFGPDTYRFVDAIERELERRTLPVLRAVDIGCGAGPGAITLARRYPRAEVFAGDINDAALRLAAVNAAVNAAFAGAANLRPVNSNLLDDVEGGFDLIVANPPYLVDPEQRTYRHGGGSLGMDLSFHIIDAAIGRLHSGGTLILYTGAPIVDGRDAFKEEAEDKLRRAGLECRYREMDPDVFGEELLSNAYSATDRIAAVVLTARMK